MLILLLFRNCVIIHERAGVLLFANTRRMTLVFIQLPVQWSMSESYLVSTTTYLYCRESKCVKLYPHSWPHLPSTMQWTDEPLWKGNAAFQRSIAGTTTRIPATEEIVHAHFLHILRVIQTELLLVQNYYHGTMAYTPAMGNGTAAGEQ